jgi:D-alanyl-D-alanine carboxypeptidase
MRFLCINLLLLLSLFNNAYAKTCSENKEQIQALINADQVKYKIPGVQVSIICPNEDRVLDFVAGTTEINGVIPVQPVHLFQIGSETKSFVAAIILQLEQEGILTIDDPISNHLDNLPETWQKISIKQLLNHTSGIYNYTDTLIERGKEGAMDLQRQWTSDELLSIARDKPLYFTPGTDWHYSNTNYVLAGLIIEKVTHHSFNDEVYIRFIDTLWLHDTHYMPVKYNEHFMQKMAHGYSDNELFPNEPMDITNTNNSWASTAGAMVSTSHDTAVWFYHLMHGNVLKPQQMTELTTTVSATLDNRPINYGLGVWQFFNYSNEEAWGHSGGTLGYSSMMLWLKNSDIIISMNVSHTSPIKDVHAISQDLAQFLLHQHHRGL